MQEGTDLHNHGLLRWKISFGSNLGIQMDNIFCFYGALSKVNSASDHRVGPCLVTVKILLRTIDDLFYDKVCLSFIIIVASL